LHAYPRRKREIVVSLRTNDRKVARQLLRDELVAIDRQFDAKRAAMHGGWRRDEVPPVLSVTTALVEDWTSHSAGSTRCSTPMNGSGATAWTT
jgi:hypothetical protein